MKRYSIILIIFLLFIYPVFTQNSAVLKSYSGKVEVKEPGGNWKPVSSGMVINAGTIISTGFGSLAVLEISNATVTVKQLTRMELSQLIKSQTSVSTDLFLNFGNVDADIEPVEDIQHNFVLKSPISTAAVRGTQFNFNGISLTVLRGSVEISNNTGRSRDVGDGQSITMSGDSIPDSSEDSVIKDFVVEPGTDPTGSGDPDLDSSGGSSTTTVNIEITWPE
jgi:hypothetical protein